jgi:hypothetical protein
VKSNVELRVLLPQKAPISSGALSTMPGWDLEETSRVQIPSALTRALLQIFERRTSYVVPNLIHWLTEAIDVAAPPKQINRIFPAFQNVQLFDFIRNEQPVVDHIDWF